MKKKKKKKVRLLRNCRKKRGCEKGSWELMLGRTFETKLAA